MDISTPTVAAVTGPPIASELEQLRSEVTHLNTLVQKLQVPSRPQSHFRHSYAGTTIALVITLRSANHLAPSQEMARPATRGNERTWPKTTPQVHVFWSTLVLK